MFEVPDAFAGEIDEHDFPIGFCARVLGQQKVRTRLHTQRGRRRHYLGDDADEKYYARSIGCSCVVVVVVRIVRVRREKRVARWYPLCCVYLFATTRTQRMPAKMGTTSTAARDAFIFAGRKTYADGR